MDQQQHSNSNAAPRFGRGFVPVSRDIGIPGEALGDAYTPSARPELVEGLSSALPPEEQGCPSAGSGQAGAGLYPPHGAWTPERKLRFLDALAEHGNARLACRAVAISPEAAYRLRRRDFAFGEAWTAALVLARAHAEQVLADQALCGTEELVYYRGELVGSRRRFDARLLLAHLARLDRLADDSIAGPHAARFDELLALVAGERFAEDMADVGDGKGGGEGRAADALLPMPAERYQDEAAERGACAGREVALAVVAQEALADGRLTRDEYDDLATSPGLLNPEEWAEIEETAKAEADRAREAARAAYADWRARVLAVTAALDGEGADVCAQDSVNCVNPAAAGGGLERDRH